MIRLPKEAAVPELYEPYCVPYAISVEQTDRSTIIDISISSEEGRGWMGEEGNRLMQLLRNRLQIGFRRYLRRSEINIC